MPMKQLRYRTRLIVILSLFAIVPAALLTILWSGSASRAISLVSGRAAWESVATSGQAAIDAVRSAPLDAGQRQAIDAHERELNVSLEQARRFSFLANRSMRLVVIVAVFALVVFGFIATRVAGHLSRQLSRPLDEIVQWTGKIERGEPLPERTARVARGAPEFATLRDRMRDMADAIDIGRRKAAEAERLTAYRESARRVAHELKNPLTPIRFAVDRLRTTATPDQSELIDVLAIESKRLERIARAFAEFGRLPEGPSSEIDVAELVRHSTLSIPPSIQVEIDAPADLPHVLGHHDALAAALSNVILNAVDACGENGVIRISASKAVLGARGAVSIEVADNGIGIGAGDIDAIWRPYVTHKPGGTGLGLAIARQAVLAHDGAVEASSIPGKGTQIRFILPAVTGPHNGVG
jgi:two-component system nitrogen regulation sensor histidine kinase NtrY